MVFLPLSDNRSVKSFFCFYLKSPCSKGLTTFTVLSLFLLNNLAFGKDVWAVF
jgi:hypothetical protein